MRGSGQFFIVESGVMTVAREVAGQRHVIAKKPLTVKMMTVRRHSRLDTTAGELLLVHEHLSALHPFTKPSLGCYFALLQN